MQIGAALLASGDRPETLDFVTLDQPLARAARLGFRRIIVFPYFLFTGVLVKRIYQQTDEVAALHPQIEFIKADYLNDHPLVLDAFVERVAEILATV